MLELILLILSATNADIKAEHCTTMAFHTRATFEYKDTTYKVEPVFNKICADVDTIETFKNRTY